MGKTQTKMSFKFLRGDEDMFLRLEPMQVLSLRQNTPHTNNEYCFQFDDDEPHVFGTGHDTLTMTIQPTTGGNITFEHNGRRFKIFARERIDE